MVTCEQWSELLWDYLYGLLDDEQAQGLREHVVDCAACQAALKEAQGQQRLVAQAARVHDTVPPFQAPEAGPAPAKEPMPATIPLPFKPGRTRRRWPWVAAAAVVLLVAGGYFWYERALADHRREADLARAAVEDSDQRITELRKTLEEKEQRAAWVRREVAQIDAGITKVKQTAQAELDRLPDQILADQFRLGVVGDGRFQASAPAQYRVKTQDAMGKEPAAVKGALRVVAEARGQPARRQVIAEQPFASDGQAVVTVANGQALPPNSAVYLEVEAQKGKVHERVREELSLARPQYVTQLALDKAVYRPGEIVFFRSLTLDRFSSRPASPAGELTATLTDSRGTRRQLPLGRARANGIACGEFPLTSDLSEGECVLEVSEARGAFPAARRRFRLENREAPRLDKALMFDRPGYQPGDEVRARFQARDRQNGAPAVNRRVEANLNVDGKRAQPLPTPPTNAKGEAKLNFKLPAKMGGKADVEIRIQEGERLETYRRAVPVSSAQVGGEVALAVEFYPEGGDLVAGLPGRVYFRVRTLAGEPADLESTLIDSGGQPVKDEQGRAVTVVTRNQNGLGTFRFTPAADKSYTLRVAAALNGRVRFGPLTVRPSGVTLSVPKPVGKEGEGLDVLVRQKGETGRLLAAVSSGGRLWDQTVVGRRDDRVLLHPPAGVHGILKVTVYRETTGNLVPLAERLVYRVPARRLRVAARTDRPAYQPGQRVELSLTTRAEAQQPVSAWLLAAVVDEQALQINGRAAPFYLSTEIERAEDLEEALVWVREDERSWAALDWYLGTQGWRRYTPAPRATERIELTMKEGSRRWDGVGGGRVIAMRVDNAVALPDQYAKAYQAARRSLVRLAGQQTQALLGERQRLEQANRLLQADRRKLGERDETLLAERKQRAAEAQRAASALASWQDLPRESVRAGLSVLVVLLVAGGSLFLVIGVVRSARGASTTTPYYAAAFASLFLCLVLMFTRRGDEPAERAGGGPAPEPEEMADAGGPRSLGEAPRMDLVMRPPVRLGRLADRGDRRRLWLDGFLAEAEGSVPLARKKANAENLRYQLREEATSLVLGEKQKKSLDRGGTAKDLQQRFADLERNQALRYPADKARGFKGDDRENKMARGNASRPPQADHGLGKGGGQGGYGVEYAHVQPRGKDRAGPVYQDTVLWSPMLQTAGGRARVAFDLSDNIGTFRILVVGHTADGRLGVAEERLISGMAAPRERGTQKGR
jgi:hypothetical protein